MNKIKLVDSQKKLKERLRDQEFKKEYEHLDEEFKMAKKNIRQKLNAKTVQKQLSEKANSSIIQLETGNQKRVPIHSYTELV